MASLPRDKGVASLEAMIAAAPDRAEPRLMLAQLLFDCDRASEVPGLLAGQLNGAHEALASLLTGRALSQSGSPHEAIALLRRAAEAGLARADAELARALARDGQDEAALAAARRGLTLDPTDSVCMRIAATALLEAGRAQEAYDLARQMWSRGIHRAQIVWTMACAARALGHDAEFRDLTTRDPWFATERLELDDAALAQEILSQKTREVSPSYKPTRGRVLRIEDLEAVDGPAIRALHASVRDAIARYRDDRLGHVAHPLMAGWPKRMQLESWSLTMADDGFEDWHMHPSAWLSAVYYVRNPARDLAAPAGRIGFLPSMASLDGTDADTWTVTPEPGRLVLFPAWYGHRTWPTGMATERISIAFNAKPA